MMPSSRSDAPMRRVLLVCDIEGISGVTRWDLTLPGLRGWHEEGRFRMTWHVRVAAQGLIEGGYDEVIIMDAHAQGQNLLPKRLADLPVRLVQGSDLFRTTMTPREYLEEVDAMVLVGMHAPSGTPHYPMAHTICPGLRLHIDGLEVGETGLNMLAAASLGVPTLVVQGDLTACQEARMVAERRGIQSHAPALLPAHHWSATGATQVDVAQAMHDLRAACASMARKAVSVPDAARRDLQAVSVSIHAPNTGFFAVSELPALDAYHAILDRLNPPAPEEGRECGAPCL